MYFLQAQRAIFTFAYEMIRIRIAWDIVPGIFDRLRGQTEASFVAILPIIRFTATPIRILCYWASIQQPVPAFRATEIVTGCPISTINTCFREEKSF